MMMMLLLTTVGILFIEAIALPIPEEKDVVAYEASGDYHRVDISSIATIPNYKVSACPGILHLNMSSSIGISYQLAISGSRPTDDGNCIATNSFVTTYHSVNNYNRALDAILGYLTNTNVNILKVLLLGFAIKDLTLCAANTTVLFNSLALFSMKDPTRSILSSYMNGSQSTVDVYSAGTSLELKQALDLLERSYVLLLFRRRIQPSSALSLLSQLLWKKPSANSINLTNSASLLSGSCAYVGGQQSPSEILSSIINLVLVVSKYS